MNSLLAKHKPKEMEKAKWEEVWKAAHTVLQPLADVLKEQRDAPELVRPSDFDCPNHYAKLVADLARKQAYQFILDLLPDTVEKD